MTKGKVLAGGLISLGGLSLISWSLINFDIHLHFGSNSSQSRPSSPGYQPPSPQPAPRRAPEATETRNAQSAPQQEPTAHSYQQCWDLARRAHSDISVAVPPECREAQQEYERRVEEQAAKERDQSERDQIARDDAAQRAEYERQRAEQQAEENRRRNEEAQRRAQDEQRRIEQDRQRRANEMIRTGKDIVDRIRRKN